MVRLTGKDIHPEPAAKDVLIFGCQALEVRQTFDAGCAQVTPKP